MKRSEINSAIYYVIERLKDFQIPLPPFAYYTPVQWGDLCEDQKEIVDNMLGWDVTDFGKCNFIECGLTVFVFRNGNLNNKTKIYNKKYCEKLLYVRDGQILPYHFHWNKQEDIINRGGGILEVTLYQSNETREFTKNDVVISMDGRMIVLPPGGKVILKPGESITLNPYQYHMWKGLKGTGDIVLFEVSTVNDDNFDNCFYEELNRIPYVEEDEPIKYLLFSDYEKYVSF